MSEPTIEAPHLGELETAIMDVLWNHGAATVRAVLNHLQRTPLAYTTVLTVMTRLVEKGLLLRTRSGRVDIYRAAYGREEFARRSAVVAVRGLVDAYGDVALAQFAAALEQADPERMARLRARIGQPPTEDHDA